MAPSGSRKRAATNASPTRKKRTTNMDKENGGKEVINRVTKSLATHGFSCTKRQKYDIGTKILLDNSIYNKGKVPSIVKDHLFVYEISQVHACGKSVRIEYKNLVITEDGDEFQTYKETEKTQVRAALTIICFVLF